MKNQAFYLIRHGETKSKYRGKYVGQTDAELSSLGLKQNKHTDDFINKLQAPVFSGVLRRTYEGISVDNKEERINEINFGEWEGLSWDQIEAKYPKQSQQYIESPGNFTFPAGESFNDVVIRSLAFINSINDHNQIVLVTHAGVIRSLMSKLFKIPLNNVFSFQIDYGRLVKLEKNGNDWRLLIWNGVIDYGDEIT